MLRSRNNVVLACTLSAVAGYVDGVGFIHLGGLFVSFMSGNSTRLGVSLADGQWHRAAEALGLIGLFVAGSACGGLIVSGGGAERQPWVLLAEGLLLAGAGIGHAFGIPQLAIAAIVLAMGLENAVFQVEGGGGLGLTYITGTLVKVGQLLAAALKGGPRWGWIPNLLLWMSLVTGAVCGALAYAQAGLAAIWLASAITLALAAILAVARRH
jgi:uncharacterized membrane protein YoaK (UPF0700 family)